MCPALHNLHECLSEERRGAALHLCQSYPQSQSTSAAPNLHLTHPTSTSPTHSSSGTLAVIRPGSQDFSPPRLLSVSHSLSCERRDLWTNRKQCARVIARLRLGRRRGASIRHLPDVTVISIDFFFVASRDHFAAFLAFGIAATKNCTARKPLCFGVGFSLRNICEIYRTSLLRKLH